MQEVTREEMFRWSWHYEKIRGIYKSFACFGIAGGKKTSKLAQARPAYGAPAGSDGPAIVAYSYAALLKPLSPILLSSSSMENKTGMQAYIMPGITWMQTSLPGLMNVTFALLVPPSAPQLLGGL